MNVTRFFYDTEFREDGRIIDLLSFGMVCETSSEELYHVNTDADWAAAFKHDWIRQNVMGSILHSVWVPNDSGRGKGLELQVEIKEPYPVALSKKSIAKELVNYVERNLPENHVPQFWAYYGSYDHVAMAQIYGTMMELPAFFPMFTMDIKQLAIMKGVTSEPQGIPPLPENANEHNALDDARWNLAMFRWLTSSDIPIQEEWL